jgi:Chs5-Arf1p-binding protein BUD7/BCH1
MPAPARTHLPLRPDVVPPNVDPKTVPAQNGTVFDENDPAEGDVHPELQRLPSLSLRGTFSAAYAILIKINEKLGWDELLKHRSMVFVMEDEYRIHRSIVEESQNSGETEELETEKLEEDLQAVDLNDSPKKGRLQIDQLVSQAQQSQTKSTSSSAKSTAPAV